MLDKINNTADQVYNEILKKIISLEFPPGTALSRKDLVEEFGVSKTPIREALLRLELDGLVNIHPQAKTVVTKISTNNIKETNFLRTALEVEVVRQIVKNKNKDIIKKLRENLEGQKALINIPSQSEVFFALDREFHEILFDSLDKKALHKHIRSDLKHRMRAVILELPGQGKLDKIYEEHKSIADAIEELDEQKAEEAVRRHLDSIIQRVEEIKKEKPEFFE